MVFRWFWGLATIGNDGFQWFSTIGPTMEWLPTIVEVYMGWFQIKVALQLNQVYYKMDIWAGMSPISIMSSEYLCKVLFTFGICLTHSDYSNSSDTFVFVTDGLSQQSESFQESLQRTALLFTQQTNKQTNMHEKARLKTNKDAWESKINKEQVSNTIAVSLIR